MFLFLPSLPSKDLLPPGGDGSALAPSAQHVARGPAAGLVFGFHCHCCFLLSNQGSFAATTIPYLGHWSVIREKSFSPICLGEMKGFVSTHCLQGIPWLPFKSAWCYTLINNFWLSSSSCHFLHLGYSTPFSPEEAPSALKYLLSPWNLPVNPPRLIIWRTPALTLHCLPAFSFASSKSLEFILS